MHFKDIARFFNISDFILYCILLVFSVLLSLRVDQVITWSYGIIFLPIWIWNVISIAGTVVGVAFYIKKRSLRQDDKTKRHFVVMLQYAILQLPIYLTELLVVVNIESNGRHSWTAIFTPMYILSFVSIGACILSCCIKRFSVELEVLAMVNLLQLIFLGIRLDGFVTWSWAAVLIPTWILLILFLSSIIVYSCVRCCMFNLYEASEEQGDVKIVKPLVTILVVCLFVIAFSFLLFLALLVTQLNGLLQAPYSATFIPLHITIIALIATTFVNHPTNTLWFGIRKEFSDFVLDKCPFLQEYTNISVQQGGVDEEEGLVESEEDNVEAKKTKRSKDDELALIEEDAIDLSMYPYEDLMVPD